ncbi:MAG: alkylation repair enzyme protein [Candidatus Beckwithbacteria bacterium GW2011_GWB1_47_15]|uniref:Alkylation repair enzyme protein n=1 Tax=Candidatus Beckwithbacteria bacterium GW2011_GWB1_47_15 TaxID=1618371 RepID=A0A0G1RXV1_9BACT|nr:MAG: alkylation repair enzyme protein [Candidatus Beckwithbacteria bacterium GW2011_GWC1_49_16]AQS30792.1 hypothetical protein [uncultured bacterium]KKU35977.1 MAG: alkylation repair enzyme protein [Candidatus Beckwithbacteria bacterium GW2011_GWA1_46_30]KKU61941.1 MAG: alkylation repair enzyme protein [Candidatus Beckwithbacteria bacterium GW2011_GWB1_47_15]KKU72505.1 MAG: alkylation repair enzyme protein [Candidatus Beckwithbacteria bacterium GW2011_GWA2_47_25]KKW04328.1 MAG: alkylation r
MTPQKFLATYRKFLKENYNAERARQEKRYLYSTLKHYGVSVWQMRKFFKKWQKEMARLNKKQALAWAKLFWAQPSHEEKSLALGVLNIHKDKLTLADMPLIEKMMRESRGWALLDYLMIPLMPGILEKDKRAYKYLTKWIKDNDFWVRRSALLAQNLFFRYGNGGDKKLFFKLAESQFDEAWIDKVYQDRLMNKRAKFFIRKAIGWALREMGEKDPKAVLAFTKKNKSKMSGLSYREATRKIEPKFGI